MTTTAPNAAIVPADNEVAAITRWEALAHDIAIAEEQSPAKQFNYRDRWDNKEARSWVAQLRKLKGRIERARKDAKSVHLDRGRAVDETARTLEGAVQGLIEPHEQAIKALEAEEQARINAHRAVLDRIAALSEGVATSSEAQAHLLELSTIGTDTLEEFATAGANRKAETVLRLQELHDTLKCQETERLELEAFRAEKAAREESERIERIRQEAVNADRLAREAEQKRQHLEAEQQANKDRELAAAREAQALAQAAVARQAQEYAERRAAEASAREQARLEAEQRAEVERLAAVARAQDAKRKRRTALLQQLSAALHGMSAEVAAEAIISGSLHCAISIDWTKA